MRKYLLIFSALFLVACENATTADNKSNVEILNEDYKINTEFYQDTKQVYDTIEIAHSENRKLEYDEEILVNEYKGKYEGKPLNEREKWIYMLINTMSTSTVETSQLESNKGFYVKTKEALLDYIDLE